MKPHLIECSTDLKCRVRHEFVLRSYAIGLLTFVATSTPASADDLVAIKPGLMCVSSDALAKLTLPDGSSRAARPNSSPTDLALKKDGGCIDITIGMRVSVKSARQNTSSVTYVMAGKSAQTYIVPNIDFQPVQHAAPGGFSINQVITGPGGNTNYYIKTLPGRNSADDPNMEIEATYNLNTSSTVLLFNRSSNDPKQNLSGFKHLILSPDNKTLYFQTEAWATSNAIHSLKISTKEVSFVAPGEIACVVLAGQFQGDLVVEQHRYFVQGGSYDNLWLYDPSGKELGLVAEDTDASKVCPTLGN